MKKAKILLVYDKQCPLCRRYAQAVRIRESVGPLTIINAREPSAIMTEITAAALNMDRGMVVKMQGQLYYGADAMHVLALIGTRVGFFNRLNFWLFKSKTSAAIFYPLLRLIRNLLLKLLHKKKINNLKQSGKQHF